VETILKKRGETIAATAIETYMERGLICRLGPL
jgi:hypothetical protein